MRSRMCATVTEKLMQDLDNTWKSRWNPRRVENRSKLGETRAILIEAVPSEEDLQPLLLGNFAKL